MSPNAALNDVPAMLPKTFDQRMKLYSVAAVATGVGMLALAQPSNAEVVITHKTIAITPDPNGPVSVLIDLNHDGIPDFSFIATEVQYHSRNAKIGIAPLTGGGVVGTPADAPFYASALMRGAKIGRSAHFSSKGFTEVERSYISYNPPQSSRHLYGEWGGNPSNRYLGVKFLIKGQTHYGWVRLSVDSSRYPMLGTITAYAYETVPDKTILAGVSPKPAMKGTTEAQSFRGASLGMLAGGAAGLAAWRRE